MAGKPGMHTRTLNPAAVERIREKIRAGMILKALEEHVVEGKEMSSTQVTAALGLLRKVVPDLTASQISGDPNNPLSVGVQVAFCQPPAK